MSDKKILTYLDNSQAVGIQIMIACFVAILVVASLVFAIALTAFVVGVAILRKAIVFILSRHETGAVFAVLGG